MDHQDWEPIYLHLKKHTDPKKKSKDSKVNTYVPSKESKLEKKIDEGDLKIKKTPAEIGKIIQGRRTAMGLTQKELAQRINIPAKTILEIESGKAKHNPQVISKIKRALELTAK